MFLFLALKDKRYSINRLSESEFSISISNVNFKDGGTYTCAYYNPNTTEMKVELTVLGGKNCHQASSTNAATTYFNSAMHSFRKNILI